MNGVCLLSEIHPRGLSQYNPLRQANEWYGLVSADEVRELQNGHDLVVAMALVEQRAASEGLKVVVRDWSHLDWIGIPFAEPTMSFAWEELGLDRARDEVDAHPRLRPRPIPQAGESEGRFCLASGRFATVRHPVDQYLSTKRLRVLSSDWDDAAMWRGMRAFAEAIQRLDWYRYEDFLVSPETVLRQICEVNALAYDEGWKGRWAGYTNVTGEVLDLRRTVIAPTRREKIDPQFWQRVQGNQDFEATLELLGYSMPEQLRRVRCMVGGVGGGWERTSPALGCRPAQERERAPLGSGEGFRRTDWDDEVVRWREASELVPTDVAAQLRLAQSLGWIGEVDESARLLMGLAGLVEAGDAEVEVQVLLLACEALQQAERKFEAIPLRRRLAQVSPGHCDNLFQLSLLLVAVGEVDESLAYCRRLLQLNPQHTGAAANFLLYMNYSDRYSAAEVSNEHFRLAMRFTERAETVRPRQRPLHERIRIGYLSSDFYTHPVGKLMLPILQSHDRERFHTTVYHDGHRSDATTCATRAAVDSFVSLRGWSDDRVLETIRSHELDVLIDLGGYTGGGNRLCVLSRRAAAVQASFLGYPNTSAIQSIDYHVTDRFADPPGLTDHLYGERLVWLDHAHIAWRPYEIAKDIASQHSGPPMLGVFNNVAKISPSAIAAYAAILRRVPEALMVLKYGDRYSVRSLQDRYRQAFAAQGVLPHRLQFRSRAESLAEHLRTMATVDLALDAFPYQGTMTSLECLSVGTPIVSCCGDFYAHRATSAMMLRMGMHELVAENAAEYVEIAVQWLHDLESLREYREEVLERFYAGPLTDPGGLTRELEAVMEIWSPSFCPQLLTS